MPYKGLKPQLSLRAARVSLTWAKVCLSVTHGVSEIEQALGPPC